VRMKSEVGGLPGELLGPFSCAVMPSHSKPDVHGGWLSPLLGMPSSSLVALPTDIQLPVVQRGADGYEQHVVLATEEGELNSPTGDLMPILAALPVNSRNYVLC